MGDFEDVFGAGADAAEIIDGYADSYNRSNWKSKVSWWGKPSDEEYEASSQWDEDDAWMASMKAKGYVRGPHFDSYQELDEWDRQNTRPHIRRPTYYGYDVFFTDEGGMGGNVDFASAFSVDADYLYGDIDVIVRVRRQRALRGGDLRFSLRVTQEEAQNGLQKTIKVPTSIQCGKCNGSGDEESALPIICPNCSGMGKVRATKGFFTVERNCPTCSGMRLIIKNPCPACLGACRVQKERALPIKIPSGVETGTRIRFVGEGEAGLRDGAPGDLDIFIEVEPRPNLDREGADGLPYKESS